MKFSYTKNPESDFYRESKSNKKKKKFWHSAGEGGRGVVRISDFFSIFFFKRIEV